MFGSNGNQIYVFIYQFTHKVIRITFFFYNVTQKWFHGDCTTSQQSYPDLNQRETLPVWPVSEMLFNHTRNGSIIDHKLDQYQKWVKNRSEMGPDYQKWVSNGSEMGPNTQKWVRNESEIDPNNQKWFQKISLSWSVH